MKEVDMLGNKLQELQEMIKDLHSLIANQVQEINKLKEQQNNKTEYLLRDGLCAHQSLSSKVNSEIFFKSARCLPAKLLAQKNFTIHFTQSIVTST